MDFSAAQRAFEDTSMPTTRVTMTSLPPDKELSRRATVRRHQLHTRATARLRHHKDARRTRAARPRPQRARTMHIVRRSIRTRTAVPRSVNRAATAFLVACQVDGTALLPQAWEHLGTLRTIPPGFVQFAGAVAGHAPHPHGGGTSISSLDDSERWPWSQRSSLLSCRRRRAKNPRHVGSRADNISLVKARALVALVVIIGSVTAAL